MVKLNNLFRPLSIRGKEFKNRIFSTGHMAVMLDDGKPSQRLAAYHGAKAHGGAALTIIGLRVYIQLETAADLQFEPMILHVCQVIRN